MITSIVRDWGVNPAIVRIESTDTLAVCMSTGYLTAQATNIANVNNGDFEFLPNDLIAVAGSDSDGLFQFLNADFSTLASFGAGFYTSVPITITQFSGMYEAPPLLVPAPNTNGMVVFNFMQLVQTYGSAALATGGSVSVQYGTTDHAGGVLASTTLANTVFQATASTVYTFQQSVNPLPFSTCAHQGLYLATDTADFTGGTGSSFVAKVWYSLIQVA